MLVLRVFFCFVFGAARALFFLFLEHGDRNQGKPWYMAYRYINSRNHLSKHKWEGRMDVRSKHEKKKSCTDQAKENKGAKDF